MKLLKSLPTVFKNAGSKVYAFGSKNSHIISGVVAGAGVIVTAVCAFKARPKFDAVMKEQKEKIDELDAVESLPEEEYKKAKREITTETIKREGAVLASTIISGAATIGAMTFSVHSSSKKIAEGIKRLNDATALATASELAYNELYDKTKEIVGEEKAQEIKNQTIQDKIDDLDAKGLINIDGTGIYDTGLGTDLFWEVGSGMLFKCSEQAIRDGILKVKGDKLLGNQGYADVNDVHSEINLPVIEYAKGLGWKRFDGNVRDIMEPNLANAVVWRGGSVRVFDWWDTPRRFSDSYSDNS